MIPLRRQIRNLYALRRGLCAAVLGLALCCGAVTPALRLALPEQVTCGMECCLESGECCCLVEFDEEPGHDEAPVFTQAELTKGCPSNCATAPASSPTFLPKADRASLFSFTQIVLRERPHEQQRLDTTYCLLTSISPRGPPNSLLNSAL